MVVVVVVLTVVAVFDGAVIVMVVVVVLPVVFKCYWTRTKINCGMAKSLANEYRAYEVPSPVIRQYHN